MMVISDDRGRTRKPYASSNAQLCKTVPIRYIPRTPKQFKENENEFCLGSSLNRKTSLTGNDV